MRRFQISSAKFQGVVDIVYNDLGVLDKIDFTNAVLSKEQQIFILNTITTTIGDDNAIHERMSTLKLVEIKEEITFEMAWNKYDDKQTSSKKKALIKWNRMAEIERIKAYNNISKYFYSLGSGIRKKYFETYLNSELWNN